MYSTATLSAYDVLSNIHVSASVRQYDGVTLGQSCEFHWETTVPGEGECEPGQWLREALLALIEVL